MEIGLIDAFFKALESNNVIVILIIGILIVLERITSYKNNRNISEVFELIENIQKNIDQNFTNDLNVKTSLEENSEKDNALAIRVDIIEEKINEIYFSTVGRKP